MNRLEKKIAKESIRRCENYLERHQYCPYVPFDSTQVTCKYIGERMEIPSMKQGYAGIKYVHKCNKDELRVLPPAQSFFSAEDESAALMAGIPRWMTPRMTLKR